MNEKLSLTVPLRGHDELAMMAALDYVIDHFTHGPLAQVRMDGRRRAVKWLHDLYVNQPAALSAEAGES